MPAARFYGQVFLSAFNKEIDWDSDTIKGMLCTSTYSPDQDTHRYKSSVTNEVSGTGYTAGGLTLASKAITYTAATNVFAIDAADLVWSNATISARYLVVYDDTPATDATKPLIALYDFDTMISSTAANFTVTFDAAGLATVTVGA